MINESHAVILEAYVARLSISDLERIIEARKEGARAALNQGNRAQLAAMENTSKVVASSVSNMIEWDRDIIARVVNNAVAGEV